MNDDREAASLDFDVGSSCKSFTLETDARAFAATVKGRAEVIPCRKSWCVFFGFLEGPVATSSHDLETRLRRSELDRDLVILERECDKRNYEWSIARFEKDIESLKAELRVAEQNRLVYEARIRILTLEREDAIAAHKFVSQEHNKTLELMDAAVRERDAALESVKAGLVAIAAANARAEELRTKCKCGGAA